eukprot:scaffold46536_cov199-Amphora_coffeaeformis.AAC.1
MSVESVTYTKCLASGSSSQVEVILCLANAFDEDMAALESASFQLSADIIQWLLVLAGSMVFFMQAGFAMLCAGCVRKKNVVNTMLKNMMDNCMAAIAYYTVGYGFAFGDGGTFIGTSHFFGAGTISDSIIFFQFTFAATAVTIVAGTLAERCTYVAYLVYSFFLAAFTYPIVARAMWSSYGFLSAFADEPLGGIGAIDYAGSGVVHCTGGMTALLATIILGPRQGRFYDDQGLPLETPNNIRGHSMALQLLGAMILWYGWYGFNCGSALLRASSGDPAEIATRVAVNTTLSAACGALSSLFMYAILTGARGEAAFSLPMAMNGALTALVGITGSAGTVEIWAAAVIGVLCGWLYIFASRLLVRLRIDDAVEAIP